jgi:hypothetical protein
MPAKSDSEGDDGRHVADPVLLRDDGGSTDDNTRLSLLALVRADPGVELKQLTRTATERRI